ncbi:gluconate 2-dehydrogenase subunit 3 family protein (plasmid) [Nitrobacter sp. NHB1]
MTKLPRYPGYDVLAKRNSPSWDAVTRRVVDERLATPNMPRFFTEEEWEVADALCRRIVPQPGETDAVSLVALLDAKLLANHGGGFREVDMPYMQEAWRKALAALDGEARAKHGAHGFSELSEENQDALLLAMQQGKVSGERWAGIDAKTFFDRRILVDVPPLYYEHPKAWNEIGFGGPASPRGYVRLDGDRPDPWEAVEAPPGDEDKVERENCRVI